MLSLIKGSVPTLDLLQHLKIFNSNFLILTISWIQGYNLILLLNHYAFQSNSCSLFSDPSCKKKLLLGAIKANNALEGGGLLCTGAGLTEIIAALCGCLKDENTAKTSHIGKIHSVNLTRLSKCLAQKHPGRWHIVLQL